MPNPTQEDIAVLDTATPERLAQMRCILNCWCWPKELPEPEPPFNFRIEGKDWQTKYRKNTRRTALANEIKRRIGLGACLKEWNRKQRNRRVWVYPYPKELNWIDQREEASNG